MTDITAFTVHRHRMRIERPNAIAFATALATGTPAVPGYTYTSQEYAAAELLIRQYIDPRRVSFPDLNTTIAGTMIDERDALNKVASRDVKVLVVGNPANTNAYIAMKSAPDLNPRNFTAMLRLDHNRALSQLSNKLGKPVGGMEKLVVWGNHSPTMYPDYRFATANGVNLKDKVGDADWNANTFIPQVGKRGAAIIEARGLSSAASAANAAIDHMRDWTLGTGVDADGAPRRTSAAVVSDGSYGVPEGLISSFPVTSDGGTAWRIVPGLEPDESVLPGEGGRLAATVAELEAERDAVRGLGLL